MPGARLFGSDNPNWKNAGWHICQQCGKKFHSYNKDRKYCSHSCYNKTRPPKPKPKKEKKSVAKRVCPYCYGFIHSSNAKVRTCGSPACRKAHYASKDGGLITKQCKNCHKKFESYASRNRIYCSYDCHIDSGGAYRAGQASVMSKLKYGAKKDANHTELVQALKKMGVQVIDTSNMGKGFPDLICCVRRQTLLVEIKNPETGYGRKGLNKLQRKFARQWTGGPVYVIKSVDDAKLLANNEFDALYAYGGFDQKNCRQV